MRTAGVRVAAAVLAVVGALGACGDHDADSAGRDDEASLQLSGRTLVVTAITEAGEPRKVARGTEIRLAFAADTVSVSAGCNTMSGSYRLDGDRLVVGELAATQMACPDRLMEQDSWLMEVLGAPLTVTDDELSGAGVVFAVADREDVSPDLELTGRRWVLESLIEGDAVSSVTSRAWMEFDGSQIEVETGCNTGRSAATVSGEVLTITGLALTRRACSDPASNQVERAMVAVLDGEREAVISERRLTVTDRASGRGLGFVAQ